MSAFLLDFFNTCWAAAGVMVIHGGNKIQKSDQLRVAFGTCDQFNQKIDGYLDRERFIAKIIDCESKIRMADFDLVVPLTIGDVLTLAQNYPAQNGYRFIVADPKVVMLAHHKSHFNTFLAENGFEEHLTPPVDTSSFPYVVKRNHDSGGRRTRLIQNREEQKQSAHLQEDADYFCQSYVPGDIEFTTHLVFWDGIQFDCTIEFKMNRQHYIRGVNMHPFKNVQLSVVQTPFRDTFSAILNALGFQGICCFNYKIVRGVPIIFELNPRFGGSLPREINRFLWSLYSVLQSNR